ncbi:hypothetical protein JMUB7526_28700 [Staphylococcus aureus]
MSRGLGDVYKRQLVTWSRKALTLFSLVSAPGPVSYTHLTLPTTPYV